MADRHDIAPPSDAAATPPSEGALALAWRVLSAPATTIALSGLIALWLLAAAMIPQGPDPAARLDRLPFHLAEVIGRVSLDDAWAAWPLLLVLLLLALNVIGLVLRFGAPRLPALGVAAGGPFDDVAEAELPATPAAVAQHAPAALGARRVVRRSLADGGVTARHGLYSEGLVLVVIGIAVLLAGLVVSRGALDARATFDVGVPEAGDTRMRAEARLGDVWVPHALPMDLRCDAPDPADPIRRLSCRVRTAQGTETTTLVPGRRVAVAGVTLAPERMAPTLWPATQPRVFIMQPTPEQPPQRLDLTPGATVRVGGAAETLTVVTGPDGPFVVAQTPGQPAVLLGPARDGAALPLPSGPVISAVPSQRLTVRIQSHPERFLVWIGGGLVALGLLLMALIAEGRLILAPAGPAGTRAIAISPNRRGHGLRVLARLAAATNEDAS